MKVRIKFAKSGVMKYIGHLDVMRYFQKAFVRAGLDVKYSEGMSPHMVLSFASPLGVGLTSNGEYADLELVTPITTEDGVRRLNEVMAEGMKVLDVRQVEEGKAGKAMSLVAAADYVVTARESMAAEDRKKVLPEKLDEAIAGFLAQDKIVVTKVTKKGEKEVDIRPLIYKMNAAEGSVFMQVSSGSTDNLKPEAVMDAFAVFCGLGELPPYPYQVEREEMYAEIAAEEGNRLVSLGDLGKVIENV